MAEARIETTQENVICADCKKEVKKAHKGVLCEICEIWFHKECQKVTDGLYAVLVDPSNSRCNWYCDYCDRGARTLMSHVRRLNKQQKETDDKLEKISERVEKLEQEGAVGNRTQLDLSEMVSERVTEEIEEYRERELRKCNLIMHNVPESKEVNVEDRKREDLEMIEKISKEINVLQTQIEKAVRLGERDSTVNNKPCMIKVVYTNPIHKRSMLLNAKKLKDSQDDTLKNIFITPDLSKRAREQSRKLRAEMNRRKEEGEDNLIIRRGKIIQKTAVQDGNGADGGRPFRTGRRDQQPR
jgi:hypothetical protein